jgi:hypothetical protein
MRQHSSVGCSQAADQPETGILNVLDAHECCCISSCTENWLALLLDATLQASDNTFERFSLL